MLSRDEDTSLVCQTVMAERKKVYEIEFLESNISLVSLIGGLLKWGSQKEGCPLSSPAPHNLS